MTLDKREILFLKQNKEIIQNILLKRKQDILEALVEAEDDKQKIGLQYLAKQFKEGLLILENIDKLKNKKQRKKNTGI